MYLDYTQLPKRVWVTFADFITRIIALKIVIESDIVAGSLLLCINVFIS